MFCGEYRHCYAIINHFGRLVRYEYCSSGISLEDVTDEDLTEIDIVPVEIEAFNTGGYRPILTCADFCASLINIRGIILTPNRLKRRI